ncbi:MAG: response regulator transcription factor [Verrucomicrobia bacterium]|nr:response regulator transcription factor [Verrucomicrobiota bacterium]
MDLPPLTVVLADDEPGSRRSLRMRLDQLPGVSVVGEASDGPQAIELLRDQRPDVAILDHHLPRLSAVELLSGLGTRTLPLAIFITRDRHVRPASASSGVVAWISRPVSSSDLSEALQRARRHLTERVGTDGLGKTGGPRIVVRSGARILMLALDDLVRAEASNNHCRLRLTQRVVTVRESLTALSARLPSRRFLRINRFTVVNADWITGLESKSHGDWIVRLRDGTQHTVTRTRRAEIVRQFRTR